MCGEHPVHFTPALSWDHMEDPSSIFLFTFHDINRVIRTYPISVTYCLLYEWIIAGHPHIFYEETILSLCTFKLLISPQEPKKIPDIKKAPNIFPKCVCVQERGPQTPYRSQPPEERES